MLDVCPHSNTYNLHVHVYTFVHSMDKLKFYTCHWDYFVARVDRRKVKSYSKDSAAAAKESLDRKRQRTISV